MSVQHSSASAKDPRDGFQFMRGNFFCFFLLRLGKCNYMFTTTADLVFCLL